MIIGTVTWDGLQCMIVALPGHTHLFFSYILLLASVVVQLT